VKRGRAAAVLLVALAACRTETAPPAIAWNARSGTIDVSGLRNPEGATVTVRSGPPDAPAMLGRLETREDGLVFHPRFPLVAGLPYHVRVNDTEVTITVPKTAAAATTHVAHVYPSAHELPANQLKFYLDFSAPMSIGDVYRHIHLVDENGQEVPRAFLQTAHELWDARRQRFTLILDPGRVKRGLRANVESGAPLTAGRRYRLVIDAGWLDGDGNPLRAPFEMDFRVIAPDRTRLDPRAWHVSAPAAGTRDALRVSFDDALDRALLEEMLIVRDERGADIPGAIEIAAGEREWTFRPRQPWTEGAYAVYVDARIEDRAGNNLRRLFDEDVQAPARSDTASHIELPFTSSRSAGR
jgi:hypothetical protein